MDPKSAIHRVCTLLADLTVVIGLTKLAAIVKRNWVANQYMNFWRIPQIILLDHCYWIGVSSKQKCSLLLSPREFKACHEMNGLRLASLSVVTSLCDTGHSEAASWVGNPW
jgi:hypothetical protein